MNLVKRAIDAGGYLSPLVIPDGLTEGTGLMNPSIFVDDDGEVLVNLRHVNYTLYHSENNQRFPSFWGPLAYLHPESDMNLRTVNYFCRLDENLKIKDYTVVKMKDLGKPQWEFVGLEDARLVRWNGVYYLIGVRRDTEPVRTGKPGEGRMEISRILVDKENWTASEFNRYRVPAPGKDDTYCEKNWVPVLDKRGCFIKWHNPVEVVTVDPTGDNKLVESYTVDKVRDIKDQRGGSQVVPYEGGYISVTHEVDLFNNYLGQKDGIYRHRLCVWDSDLQLLGLSEPFSFLGARIEFCTGLAVLGDDVLLSFGFQDNAAFVLRTPKSVINELKKEALNGN